MGLGVDEEAGKKLNLVEHVWLKLNIARYANPITTFPSHCSKV